MFHWYTHFYSTSQIKVYILFSNYDCSKVRIVPFRNHFVIVSHPYPKRYVILFPQGVNSYSLLIFFPRSISRWCSARTRINVSSSFMPRVTKCLRLRSCCVRKVCHVAKLVSPNSSKSSRRQALSQGMLALGGHRK